VEDGADHLVRHQAPVDEHAVRPGRSSRRRHGVRSVGSRKGCSVCQSLTLAWRRERGTRPSCGVNWTSRFPLSPRQERERDQYVGFLFHLCALPVRSLHACLPP